MPIFLSPQPPLVQAIFSGDPEEIRMLIYKSEDINALVSPAIYSLHLILSSHISSCLVAVEALMGKKNQTVKSVGQQEAQFFMKKLRNARIVCVMFLFVLFFNGIFCLAGFACLW